MIERRPILDLIGHLVLLCSVALIAYPLYIAFVASTQTAEQSAQAPLSLIPGTQFIHNYLQVFVSGASGQVDVASIGRKKKNRQETTLGIAFGKISISMLSAFALVY